MLLRVPQENELVDYLAYKLVHRLIVMIVYYIVALFNISFCVNVQGEKYHQSHEGDGAMLNKDYTTELLHSEDVIITFSAILRRFSTPFFNLMSGGNRFN